MDIGGVMISQIGGLDSCRAAKDPRRKAQSMRFKNNATAPSHIRYKALNKSPKESAAWTSFSIFVGSALFLFGVATISLMKRV